MVPQKTGVLSDFSHTLSHLQHINYSSNVNEDQVPVLLLKWGTGMRFTVCYLTSSSVSLNAGLLVDEEAVWGEWLQGGFAQVLLSGRMEGRKHGSLHGGSYRSPHSLNSDLTLKQWGRASLHRATPGFPCCHPFCAESCFPESWKELSCTIHQIDFWKVLCYQLVPGKVWL